MAAVKIYLILLAKFALFPRIPRLKKLNLALKMSAGQAIPRSSERSIEILIQESPASFTPQAICNRFSSYLVIAI